MRLLCSENGEEVDLAIAQLIFPFPGDYSTNMFFVGASQLTQCVCFALRMEKRWISLLPPHSLYFPSLENCSTKMYFVDALQMIQCVCFALRMEERWIFPLPPHSLCSASLE